jgi:hypothetical protein
VLPERAGAVDGYYSRGDAEAVLGAYSTGGGAIDAHTGTSAGPSRSGATDLLSIRPISPFFDGVRYCVADWHAIALAFIDFEFVAHFTEPQVYTQEDAYAYLSTASIEFRFDREVVQGVTAGPIQPYTNTTTLARFEVELEAILGVDVTVGRAWAVQWGRAVPPDYMDVGRHSLTGLFESQIYGSDRDTVGFWVDPIGSAACNRG